jgi:hypothetical protein
VHHRVRNVAPRFSRDIELQLLGNLPIIGANFSAVQKSRRDFIATTVADTGIATRFAGRCIVAVSLNAIDNKQLVRRPGY